jgi:heme-degrading monooxygenase HmoA
MVITILEAQVATEKSILLEEAYNQGIKRLDVGITQTFLSRNSKDPSRWQIVTVWQNRDVLEAMRRSGNTPRGVQMFRAADAEPVLSVFDVVDNAVAST